MSDSTKATDQDIEMALCYLARATKGPASWVEPATGVNDAGERNDPVTAFADMIRDGGTEKVHGVSVAVGGGRVTGTGKDHLVVAITGNGPCSEANARAITLMFEPVIGYEAMLREVIELRRKLARYEGA